MGSLYSPKELIERIKIYSPKKLIELIKNSSSIANELKEQYDERSIDWYFSSKGEDAYKIAKTPAQKTKYFFDYLSVVAESTYNRDVLYKIAYIMTNSINSSSLAFAGYPDILDSTKNPLVNYVKNTKSASQKKSTHGLMLLAAINGENDTQKYLNAEHRPYTRLTYCGTDGDFTDKYRLERDIIGAFCIDHSQRDIPPFIYQYGNVENQKDDKND